jgi:hypothetical protein
MEVWKKVPFEEYEEIYLISSKGRLKNAKTGRIHAVNLDSDGYPHYLLCSNNKRKPVTAHRLVALAFIDNPSNLPCINHKDENKTNNSVENLEWCTVKHNNCYGTKLQRLSDKLSRPVAQMMNGEVLAVYKNSMIAQKATGVDFSKIRMCCRGVRKHAGGYEWKEITEEENV